MKHRLFESAKVIIFFLSLFFLSDQIFCEPTNKKKSDYSKIDLTKNTWYAKAGFNKEDKNGFRYDRAGVEPIRSFPVLLNKIFEQEDDADIRHYTMATEFTWDEKLSDSIPRPAIFLSGIGEDWEIYLNGEKIADHLEEDQIKSDFFRMDEIVSLPVHLLRDTNMLVFHFAGYRKMTFITNNKFLGFGFTDGYFIANERELEKSKSQNVFFILIGVYLFFGFYSIFFYLRYPPSKYNLYFGVFTVIMAVYLAVFSNASFQYIQDSRIILLIRYITQPLMLFIFVLFTAEYYKDNNFVEKFLKISAVLNGLVFLLFLFLPYPYYQSILVFWYLLSIPQFIYVVYFVAKVALGGSTDAIIMVSTMGFVLLAAVWDMGDSALFMTGLRFLRFGLFLFILSMTALLANRFVNLQKETVTLNENLGKKNTELDFANMQIRASEEKYRHLVESFSDVIFILNENFEIITSNKASMKVLGLRPKDLEGLPFISLAPVPKDESVEVQRHLIKETLNELVKTKKSVEFKAIFENRQTGEPKELTVILQFIQHDDRFEILGRAYEKIEDELVEAFLAEKSSYKIKNYLTQGDNISQRITQNLSRYVEPSQAQEIRISLREMIINAIEHGNLGISFDEKTAAMLEERLFDLVKSRQEDPKYKDRKIKIASILTSKKFAVYIEDEGEGFDHKKYMSKAGSEDQHLAHGRGIMMAKSVFNVIKYNNKGNGVTLLKKLK